jgi:hypothetical protein
MRDTIDGIRKSLILRKPRSGCLEGRIALIQLARDDRRTREQVSSVWYVPPVVRTRIDVSYLLFTVAGMTKRKVRAPSVRFTPLGSMLASVAGAIRKSIASCGGRLRRSASTKLTSRQGFGTSRAERAFRRHTDPCRPHACAKKRRAAT